MMIRLLIGARPKAGRRALTALEYGLIVSILVVVVGTIGVLATRGS